MKREGEVNYLFFVAALFFMCLGVVVVYSISFVYAQQKFGDPGFFMKRQMIFVTLSVFAMLIFAFIPLKVIRKMTPLAVGGIILLLIAVLIPGISHPVKGVHRWLKIGPFNFQPSEFAKLAVVLYMSDFIARKKELLNSFTRGFIPPLIVVGVLASLVVVEPDFGGAAFLCILAMAMLFAGGAPVRYFLFTGSAGLVAASLLILSADYRLERVKAFLDPWKFVRSSGFQTVQSFLALGSGGLTGVGLGNSRQKLFYLPEAHTDFVLAVLGEEVGFVGLTLILGALMFMAFLGFRIAMKAESIYEKMLGAGMTLLLVIQGLLNAGVVLGLLPPKGMPFPFLSYGGSFLLVTGIACGIILNVSRRGR